MLVAGLLVAAAMVLLWRAFCEFYVAIFRISEDLRACARPATPTTPWPPSTRPAGPEASAEPCQYCLHRITRLYENSLRSLRARGVLGV